MLCKLALVATLALIYIPSLRIIGYKYFFIEPSTPSIPRLVPDAIGSSGFLSLRRSAYLPSICGRGLTADTPHRFLFQALAAPYVLLRKSFLIFLTYIL